MPLAAWVSLTDIIRGERVKELSDLSMTDQPRRAADIRLTMAMHRYCQEIINPPSALQVYVTPLSSMDECLVYLCIDNVLHFGTQELLSLATMHQLAVLELIQWEASNSGISDGLLKGWSEFDRSFPFLRVLKITSDVHAVSKGSLEYVLGFPKLEIYDITAVPRAAWRNADQTAWELGFKVSDPQGSLFVSYAKAYLDERGAVNMTSTDHLRAVFEDDRQKLALVRDPRQDMFETHRDEIDKRLAPRDPYSSDDEYHDLLYSQPYLSTYLDDGWRALLAGTHALSGAALPATQSNNDVQHGDLSDDEAFWFLSLLGQQDYDPRLESPTVQAAGLTLMQKQFVSLRLRNPTNIANHRRGALNTNRLIFSRIFESEDESPAPRSATGPKTERVPPQPPAKRKQCPEESKRTDLRSRKQQNIGNLLTSFK